MIGTWMIGLLGKSCGDAIYSLLKDQVHFSRLLYMDLCFVLDAMRHYNSSV